MRNPLGRLLAGLLILATVGASAQIVPGVLRVADYPDPPDTGAGDWTYKALGSGTCTSVTDSAGTLTIEAAGADWDNGCFVYQLIPVSPEGDGAQIYGRVVSLTGTASSTAKAGPMIANNSTNTAAMCHARWSAPNGKPTGAYTPANGADQVGGIIGLSTALPVHLGLKYTDTNPLINLCKMYEAASETPPADPSTDFDGMPQPHTGYLVDMSGYLAGFYIQSGHATNTATVTIDDYAMTNVGSLVDNYLTGPSPPQNPPAYLSAFETIEDGGVAQDKLENPDGWLRQTMDAACPGGAFCQEATDYSYSDQIKTSDGSVSPRSGSKFLRFETRNGDNPLESVYNPRAQYVLWRDTYEFVDGSATTHWAQWSMYIPSANFSVTYDTILTQSQTDVVGGHPWILYYNPTLGGSGAHKLVAWNWPNGVKNQIDHQQLGNTNPITAYFDEWVDWRITIVYSNDENGRLKLEQRRPGQTSAWTTVADYSGPLGRDSGYTYNFKLDLYGGIKKDINAGESPLIVYFDEVRIQNSTDGTIDDVEIP